jgi:hypothetical protein
MAKLPATASINLGMGVREVFSRNQSSQSSLIEASLNLSSLGRPSKLIQQATGRGHGPHGLNQLTR